ncbi:MAG: zinc metalloprotease HtpX [Planctomycetota bacterium]
MAKLAEWRESLARLGDLGPNLAQTGLLLGGMLALYAVCGALVFGATGAWIFAVVSLVLFVATPKVSPRLLLRLYNAIPVHVDELRKPYELLRRICLRSGLSQVPELYYIPSSALNAFTLGRPNHAFIAVTDGLLRQLSLRELAGMLAHEVAHILQRDTFVLAIADWITRITRWASYIGILCVIVTLPLALVGRAGIEWIGFLLIALAPTLCGLLQNGLSRTRELAADDLAVEITTDPVGLALALERLERYESRLWEDLVGVGRRIPDPSLLRTHPPTELRIQRLLSRAAQPRAKEFERLPGPVAVPKRLAIISRRPRWHVNGLWY